MFRKVFHLLFEVTTHLLEIRHHRSATKVTQSATEVTLVAQSYRSARLQ